MRQITWLFWVLGIWAAVAACDPAARTGGYTVMFEKQPRLTDSGVYIGSNRVGSVAEPTGAMGRVARLTVHIEAPHRETIKNNTVFYVSGGRLVLATLDGFGEPLPAGGMLLGFNSKAGLLWFKARHLLKNQPAAAGRQAEKLYNLTM